MPSNLERERHGLGRTIAPERETQLPAYMTPRGIHGLLGGSQPYLPLKIESRRDTPQRGRVLQEYFNLP